MCATTSSRWSRRARIGPDSPPASCCKAASSWAGFAASMTPEHRLGPGQVDPAGEERAEGELARLGMARTLRQAMGQDQAHERWRADQVDLGDVLAGIRPGCRPECQHHRQERPQAVDPELAPSHLRVSRRRPVRLGAETRRAPPPRPAAPTAGRSRAAEGPGGLAIAAIVSFGSMFLRPRSSSPQTVCQVGTGVLSGRSSPGRSSRLEQGAAPRIHFPLWPRGASTAEESR